MGSELERNQSVTGLGLEQNRSAIRSELERNRSGAQAKSNWSEIKAQLERNPKFARKSTYLVTYPVINQIKIRTNPLVYIWTFSSHWPHFLSSTQTYRVLLLPVPFPLPYPFSLAGQLFLLAEEEGGQMTVIMIYVPFSLCIVLLTHTGTKLPLLVRKVQFEFWRPKLW